MTPTTQPPSAEEVLGELLAANDALQARSWPGGPADYEQQRGRLREAWAAARAWKEQAAAPAAQPDATVQALRDAQRYIANDWAALIESHSNHAGEIDEDAQPFIDEAHALLARLDSALSAPAQPAAPAAEWVPELPNGAWQQVPCAVCFEVDHPQHGWLFIPHADGKWVSLCKLPQFSEQVIRYWLKEPNTRG